MKWKLVGVLALSAISILSVVLASARLSQARPSANSAPVTYSYKVERVGERGKDLEPRLNDDGQKGWRVSRIVAIGPYHNDLVVVLEKPAGAP